MKEIDRSGVMVDICPSCKGVWLDRGEIDKIMAVEGKEERVVPVSRQRDDRPAQERRDYRDHGDDDDHDRDHEHQDEHRTQGQTSGGKKRRSSFLQDILGGLGE